ncbi:hypothetical protein, variant [Fonticula alba]|uniref:Actin-related protein 5 n=1 Tax=Fonticula alba TaxID=691883 RepID=A0A058Z705_FONAL|nr:hypothetical protein, variant [Fonticula alba]KCV70025.1 hypothetical protein, variant [Fonticula alba]|eukprot:XP_009495631.1 hypothetical protein, variant [Fonticula alba]
MTSDAPPGLGDSPSEQTRPIYHLPQAKLPSLERENPPRFAPATGDQRQAIIIDNGSFNFRAGWSSDPAPCLDFPSVAAKPRVNRKTDDPSANLTRVGHAVYADPTGSRLHARQPHGADHGLLVNFDVMEEILDFSFARLGVRGQAVDHPLVITEAFCLPNGIRSATNEMLFELYGAPAVSHGVDFLYAYHYGLSQVGSQSAPDASLIVAAGYRNSHVVPVLDGQVQFNHARRVDLGGASMESLLGSILSMKYPHLQDQFNSPHTLASLIHEHCRVSTDYSREIMTFFDRSSSSLLPEALKGQPTRDIFDRLNRIIQCRVSEALLKQNSPEEIERIRQMRAESGRRLQEQAAKKRAARMARLEEVVDNLRVHLAEQEVLTPKAFQAYLSRNGFQSVDQLLEAIQRAEGELTTARNRALGIDTTSSPKTEAAYPLLDVPDEQLTPAEVREKRKQRLLKGAADARARAQEQRQTALQAEAEQAELDRLAYEADPRLFIAQKLAERQRIIERLRESRSRRQQLLSRHSATAQKRMRHLANLASSGEGLSSDPSGETGPSRGGRRRGRGRAGGRGNQDDSDDDNFGADDSDWSIYREISTEGDQEAEEEDLALLAAIETQIVRYEPAFTPTDLSAPNAVDSLLVDRSQDWLLALLTHGVALPAFFNTRKRSRGFTPTNVKDAMLARGISDETLNLHEQHQIHLNIERLRVPEVRRAPCFAFGFRTCRLQLTHRCAHCPGSPCLSAHDRLSCAPAYSCATLPCRLSSSHRSLVMICVACRRPLRGCLPRSIQPHARALFRMFSAPAAR